MELSTKVNLSGLILDNPVIPASGAFGFGEEFSELYDIKIYGSLSFKGTTREERLGNPLPRIAECPAGMLNSVGLQNPGVEHVINYELKNMKNYYNKPVIANISGFSEDEYVYLAKKMNDVDNVGIIEVNISCPNVENGGMTFGTSEYDAAKITEKVKNVCDKPVYMKLSPNVTDIAAIAVACEKAGADGISLINTLLGMRIDIKSRKAVLANKYGGLSGPAIMPVALRMVNQVFHAVKIPIIGMGGISSANDVIEFIMAGATAVQIGAANLVNPFLGKQIIEDLPQVMKSLNIENLNDIKGIV